MPLIRKPGPDEGRRIVKSVGFWLFFLLGSVDAGGDLVAMNLSLLLHNRVFPASRALLAGFTGEEHPWHPRYGEAAAKLIGDMAALALRREMTTVGDLYTTRTTYRPGEVAEVRGTLYGTCSGKRRVRITALPYQERKPLATAELELEFQAPGPLPFTTMFSIPGDFGGRRINLFAEVLDGGMSAPQRALIPVKLEVAPTMSEFRMTERYATLDGRACRSNGCRCRWYGYGVSASAGSESPGDSEGSVLSERSVVEKGISRMIQLV